MIWRPQRLHGAIFCTIVKIDSTILKANADFWIVAGFALAHAVTAVILGALDISDELLLTLLTMVMTILLCQRRKLNIEITAACAILTNVLGFILGIEAGSLFHSFISSATVASAFATLLTTVILGIGIIWLSGRLHRNQARTGTSPAGPGLKIIIAAFVMIFCLRILVFVFSTSGNSHSSTLEILAMMMSNSAVTITVICLNVIFVRYSSVIKSAVGHTLFIIILCAFILLLSFVYAAMLCLHPDCHVSMGMNMWFVQLLVFCVVAVVSYYSLVYLFNYVIESRQTVIMEREKRHSAQFRYEKLKQQVNPHFLFNSLNVLDGLVTDGQTENASEFIHKLAGLYRYMLNSEDEETVPLTNEMEFVDQFIDLMKARFPVGFEVREDIRAEDLNKAVPPCAVQMLVENAFKHNGVAAANPLKINIMTDGEYITVSNSLIPKKSLAPSTGVGLKYIRQQYKDLENKEIEIKETADEYIVRLPLIGGGNRTRTR